MQTEGLKNGDGSGNNDSVCHFLFCCVCFTSSRDSRVPPLLLQQHSSSLQQHTAVKKTLALGRHSPLSLSLSLLFFCRLLALCAETPCLGSAARQPSGRKEVPSANRRVNRPGQAESTRRLPPVCPPASLIERLVTTTVGARRLHSWKLICPLSSQGWDRKSHGIYKSVNDLSGSPFGKIMT